MEVLLLVVFASLTVVVLAVLVAVSRHERPVDIQGWHRRLRVLRETTQPEEKSVADDKLVPDASQRNVRLLSESSVASVQRLHPEPKDDQDRAENVPTDPDCASLEPGGQESHHDQPTLPAPPDAGLEVDEVAGASPPDVTDVSSDTATLDDAEHVPAPADAVEVVDAVEISDGAEPAAPAIGEEPGLAEGDETPPVRILANESEAADDPRDGGETRSRSESAGTRPGSKASGTGKPTKSTKPGSRSGSSKASKASKAKTRSSKKPRK